MESPTARALMAFEAVQGSPGITADRLAERLGGISDRAARRYIAILREAGIPIESVRGPYGGYRVGRGARPAPLIFTQAEALGLVMAVLDGHHAAGDTTDPVGSALGKIVRVLPEALGAQVEAVRRTAAPAPDRAAARPDPEITSRLVQACAQNQTVRVNYRSEAGNEWTTDADPWAIVVRHGRWYLLCHAHRPAARRTYRIDRVTRVDILPTGFVPPSGLDPIAVLDEHLATGWEYDAEILIHAEPDRVAESAGTALGTLRPGPRPGTTVLTGTTSAPYWYARQLTAIPVPYRILGGPEVLTAARDIATRMLDATTPAPLDPTPRTP
ncbi:helix-turn-helix transcriptional regulator [Actinoplanes xinjiangensis]|uniref:Putative DNA-binding transcriptional regulator YafY n=1 Tax=Actinoplanes xinjiangensis TaxID=512350 RepID=A0A316F3P5_9ACTN|nr:WYL domain-containing protein [Actinoplanes xinjiangensis]PWK31185.1 putative DNA-binding transcriptional regulator YafY [Actinoplanes xinjiangensis]GIF44137.1 transcriptional regulator [Actinoplanes xinjiangensis]